ncbi:MAG: hypothetical protein JSS02_30245 [Planctomycetes bacterium]|nr:hypothetical protein [Planctomycetota bacterium]
MIRPEELLADAAIDLVELCDQDRAKTVQLIEALLVDDDWIAARIAWLQAIDAAAADLNITPVAPGDFTRELALLEEPGVWPAYEHGQLSAERLVALLGDARALAKIAGFDERVPESATQTGPVGVIAAATRPNPIPVAGETRRQAETAAENWTRLVRSDWSVFRRQIEPWLPVLLEQAGVDARQAPAFLEWITAQRDQLLAGGRRRLRECWPDWVAAFARDRLGQTISPPRVDPQAFVERLRQRAVELALSGSAPFTPADREPAWVASFRAAGLQQQSRRPLVAADLLSITLPPDQVSPTAIAGFRRTLVYQIELFVQETEAWI